MTSEDKDFAVDFLVKLRDTAQMMADACNEQLEKMAPPEVKYSPEDFERLFWKDLQGSKGPFQRTGRKANNNSELFQALQAILKGHKGFCHIGLYKYWFNRGGLDVIDRRKK